MRAVAVLSELRVWGSATNPNWTNPMELRGFGCTEDPSESFAAARGTIGSTLQLSSDRNQASLLWVSAVGLQLRSRQSTFALPLLLVIGCDTVNAHGFCSSISWNFGGLSPAPHYFKLLAGSLWSTPHPHHFLCFHLTSCTAALSRSVKSWQSTRGRRGCSSSTHFRSWQQWYKVEGKI